MRTQPEAVVENSSSSSSSRFVEFETTEIIHCGASADKVTPALINNLSNPETNDGHIDPRHVITTYSLLMESHKASIEEQYQTFLHQLPQTIEEELNATRMQGDLDILPLVDAINREIGLRNRLLAGKNAEYREKIRVANLFYGSDPTDKSLADFYLKAAGMEMDADSGSIAIMAWLISYQAAWDSRLVFRTIQMLSEQANTVQIFLNALRVDDES